MVKRKKEQHHQTQQSQEKQETLVGQSAGSPAGNKATTSGSKTALLVPSTTMRPVIPTISGGSIGFGDHRRRTAKRALSDESRHDSRNSVYCDGSDPVQEFAAMKASVQARQASGMSMLGKGSSRFIRGDRSGHQVAAAARSAESMPKMGIAPKKVTAGFTPMSTSGGGGGAYAGGPPSPPHPSSQSPHLSGGGAVESPSKLLTKIVEKEYDYAPEKSSDSTSRLKPPPPNTKKMFGPAAEKNHPKIFGPSGAAIVKNTSSERFNGGQTIKAHSPTNVLKTIQSLPTLEERKRKRKKKKNVVKS